MNKGLKNKGLGSWFCLAAALVALITGIVFLLTQATAAPLGHSGTMAGVVLLVGAAASLVFFFVSVPFSALIQAGIYNIALYLVVVQSAPLSKTSVSAPSRSMRWAVSQRIFTGTPWDRPIRTVRSTTGQPSASIKIVGIVFLSHHHLRAAFSFYCSRFLC